MTEQTSEFTGEPAGTDDLTECDRHELLASDRRRMALDVLAGQTASVELGDLAVALAAREEGSDGVDVETRERVAVSLHHIHLPKLADAGVIDYDVDARTVSSCPEANVF